MSEYLDLFCKKCGDVWDSFWIDEIDEPVTIQVVACPTCASKEAYQDGYDAGYKNAEYERCND